MHEAFYMKIFSKNLNAEVGIYINSKSKNQLIKNETFLTGLEMFTFKRIHKCKYIFSLLVK